MNFSREKNGRYDDQQKCSCCKVPVGEYFYGIDHKLDKEILSEMKEAFDGIVEFGKDGFFQGCEDCGNVILNAAGYFSAGGSMEDFRVFRFSQMQDFTVLLIETLVHYGYDIKPYLFDKAITLKSKVDFLGELLGGVIVVVSNGKLISNVN